MRRASHTGRNKRDGPPCLMLPACHLFSCAELPFNWNGGRDVAALKVGWVREVRQRTKAAASATEEMPCSHR